MKRPLLLAALSVLSGTALGIREMPQEMKAAAILMMTAVCLRAFRGTGEGNSEEPAPERACLPVLVLLAALFSGSFFRAFSVSASFHTPEAEVFFDRLEAANPGQFDYAMYLKGQGVSSQEELDLLQAAKEGGLPVEEDRQPADPLQLLLHKTAQFRILSETALDLALSPEDSGILKAVLLGQKSTLDEEIRDLYQASGIAHLLAVSGLHVSMLGMGLFGILRKGRWSRTAAGAAAGLMAVWYLIMIGLPGSSARAGIMLLLTFAAGAAGRFYDMQSALSAALILMIWHRPYRIFQSGFQLSFAAVSSIAFVSGNLIHAMEKMAAGNAVKGNIKRIGSMFRLPGWQTALVTGACIQLVTLPVIAWHYFVFPVYGCILNLAVIPLMGLVLASGLAVLGVLLSYAAAKTLISGSFLIRPGMLSAAAAAPGHYILRFYEKLCLFSLRLPYSTVLIGRPSLWQILIYYLVLGNAARILLCGSKRPVRSRQRIFLLWSVLILNSFILRPVRLPGVKVTAIDVGQGDGFLIEKGKHTFLIDCGSSSNRSLGSRVLEPLLLSKGIGKVDAAIVSHGDTDHISGLLYLMEEEERIRVSSLILPGPALGNNKYECLIKAFEQQKHSDKNKILILNKDNSEHDKIKYLTEGDVILDDQNTRLSCLYAGNRAEKENVNRHSTALLLESGHFRMLFTGDMEAADETELGSNWEKLCPGKTLTVLKAAHHGSATSSSETLIRKLQPKYAVISAGKNNRYGHPSPEVTKRLEDHGAVLLQTAEHGAVEIRVFKNCVRIFGFRNG